MTDTKTDPLAEARVRVKFELKLQDCWIGVFWRSSVASVELGLCDRFELWICLLPMLPLHFTRDSNWRLIPFEVELER